MYYFLCILGIKEIRLHHIILINNVAKKEQGSGSETIITDPDLESSKLTDPSGSGSGTLHKRIVSLVKHKSR
jgi:ABC-type iron transport system FetAB ATPase subunit